jgi:hypothetical protein
VGDEPAPDEPAPSEPAADESADAGVTSATTRAAVTVTVTVTVTATTTSGMVNATAVPTRLRLAIGTDPFRTTSGCSLTTSGDSAYSSGTPT